MVITSTATGALRTPHHTKSRIRRLRTAGARSACLLICEINFESFQSFLEIDGARKNAKGSGKKPFDSLTCFLSIEGEKLFTPSLQAHLDGPPTDVQPLPDLQTRKALVLVEPQASPVVGRQALEHSLDDLMISHALFEAC